MTPPIVRPIRVRPTRAELFGTTRFATAPTLHDVIFLTAVVLGVFVAVKPGSPGVLAAAPVDAASAPDGPIAGDDIREVWASLRDSNAVLAADSRAARAVDALASGAGTAAERSTLYFDLRRDGRSLESLMWVLARHEPDAKARALAYEICPKESLKDVDALVAAARAEYTAEAREALNTLMPAMTVQGDPRIREFLIALIRLDEGKNATWRAEFLPAVHQAFASDPNVVAQVDQFLNSRDESIRANAALARGQSKDRHALDVAVALLASNDAKVQRIAATTIERYGEVVDIHALAGCFHSEDAQLRAIARRAYSDKGIPAPSKP